VIAPLRTLDQREEERRMDGLRALVRKVIEDPTGARPVNPPAFHPPADFLYHVEMIQRLAPWYPDWKQIVQTFAALGVRHAYLYGRDQVEAEDLRAMARVARDSVPPWIRKALLALLEEPAGLQHLENVMALEEKSRRSGHGAKRELGRLRQQAVIEWSPQKMHWRIAEMHRQAVERILNGGAFGVMPETAAAFQ